MLIGSISCLLKRDVPLDIPTVKQAARKIRNSLSSAEIYWGKRRASQPWVLPQACLSEISESIFFLIRLCLFHHSDTNSMNSISQRFENDLGRFAYYWKRFIFYRNSLSWWRSFISNNMFSPLQIWMPNFLMYGLEATCIWLFTLYLLRLSCLERHSYLSSWTVAIALLIQMNITPS